MYSTILFFQAKSMKFASQRMNVLGTWKQCENSVVPASSTNFIITGVSLQHPGTCRRDKPRSRIVRGQKIGEWYREWRNIEIGEEKDCRRMIGSPEGADGHETNVIGEPSRLLPVARSFSSLSSFPRALLQPGLLGFCASMIPRIKTTGSGRTRPSYPWMTLRWTPVDPLVTHLLALWFKTANQE